MALKWLCVFAHWQKTKRTVPNVYFIPEDSSLIVTPEFDYPLPPSSYSGITSSPQDAQNPAGSPDPVLSSENRSSSPISSQYHYVLSRQARDNDDLPTSKSGDCLNDAHRPPPSINASTESIPHSSGRSKLTKSQRRKGPPPVRAYDPGLHWPTSVSSNTPLTFASAQDLASTSAPGTDGDRPSVHIEPTANTNPSSPTASTAALSATSEGLISRSTSGGAASRRNSFVAKKLTKRKRPPPVPPIDTTKDRPAQAVSNKRLTAIIPDPPSTPYTSQARSNRRVVTAASVAADYARFWNISVPNLPSARQEHTPRPPTPTPPPVPTHPRPRAHSYVARKPVPGPSPLRDNADWRPYNRFERDSKSDVLHGTNPSSSRIRQNLEEADHDVLTKHKWHELYRGHAKRSSLSASGTTFSAFSLYGIHDVGENKSAWQSTWSVEEAPLDHTPKTSLPRTSKSTTALDDTPPPHQSLSRFEKGDERMPIRPLMMHRNAEDSLRRRWTVASAVTDEEITDDVLMKNIDSLRRRGSCTKANVYGGPQAQLQYARRRFSKYRSIPSPSRSLGASEAPVWQTARLALLACRELVRTERTYLSHIRQLLDEKGTSTPTPKLVKTYVPALVNTSEKLLRHMLDDPSAWGIASAFVKCEVALESAFVSWCGIVGALFVENVGTKGLARVGSSGSQREEARSAKVMVDGMRKRRNSTPVPGYPLTRTRSLSPVRPFSMMLMRSKSTGKEVVGTKQGKPSVRELAILPTQRIMRYVILYRGLLEHTPSPPSSRAMVEAAVNVALRIAQKCDRAQDNADFLLR